eukprot:scaffold69426_cov55-Prasinocladus_malaysianus.AAC.2
MCIFGFVIAATWIAFVAGELVAMLQFFGYLSGVNSAVLGLTVLAWGNSVGDLSTNMAMAKRYGAQQHGPDCVLRRAAVQHAGGLLRRLLAVATRQAVRLRSGVHQRQRAGGRRLHHHKLHMPRHQWRAGWQAGPEHLRLLHVCPLRLVRCSKPPVVSPWHRVTFDVNGPGM